MAIGFASAGYAEDAEGQKPPPVPDRGTTSQLNCIDENATFTRCDNSPFFVMTYENKCEARMKCAVFAYTINARGAAHGRSTVILGPKSGGAAAKTSYALKVKGMGGYGTSARECRVF